MEEKRELTNEEKAVRLAYFLWKSIDHEGMSTSRRMGIWDEFQQKLIYAAMQQTPEAMIEVFAKKFSIMSYKHSAILAFMTPKAIDQIRRNPRKIVLMLRVTIEEEKADYKAKGEEKAEKEKAKERMKRMNADWEQFIKGDEKNE